MSSLKPAIFCILYTFPAIWAQFFLPSMDMFSPALLVLLQSGLFKAAIWAGLAWMLIQEGTGTLAFGTMILFYLGFAVFYFTGGMFFEVSNYLFTFLLFLFLSAYRAVLVSVMATLQDMKVTEHYSPEGILIQALILFSVWMITFNLFKKNISL